MAMTNRTSGPKTSLQRAAQAVGAVFLLAGVLGFIPGITSNYQALSFAGHRGVQKETVPRRTRPPRQGHRNRKRHRQRRNPQGKHRTRRRRPHQPITTARFRSASGTVHLTAHGPASIFRRAGHALSGSTFTSTSTVDLRSS